MAYITNSGKVLPEIKDVNLLEEKGIIKVSYDNDGYMLKVIWFSGYSSYEGTEHEDVLVMESRDGGAFGFMIHDVDHITDGVDGYVTVNLKSDLEKYANAVSPNGQDAGGDWQYNPIERGIIHIRYDRDENYCHVFWADGAACEAETDNENVLAYFNHEGILCGFRIINTDIVRENPNPIGWVDANLKIRMDAPITVQAGES